MPTFLEVEASTLIHRLRPRHIRRPNVALEKDGRRCADRPADVVHDGGPSGGIHRSFPKSIDDFRQLIAINSICPQERAPFRLFPWHPFPPTAAQTFPTSQAPPGTRACVPAGWYPAPKGGPATWKSLATARRIASMLREPCGKIWKGQSATAFLHFTNAGPSAVARSLGRNYNEISILYEFAVLFRKARHFTILYDIVAGWHAGAATSRQ